MKDPDGKDSAFSDRTVRRQLSRRGVLVKIAHTRQSNRLTILEAMHGIRVVGDHQVVRVSHEHVKLWTAKDLQIDRRYAQFR